MNETKSRVINYVDLYGPVLPVQISKEIDCNILMAAAILSELVSEKKLLITNVKKGGSPFYYFKGQEQKLESLSNNLHGKEKEIYDIIKEKRILRDIEIEPWQRIAIRSIKDYAIPLRVKNNDNEEIFWVWYLDDVDESKNKIRETYFDIKEVKKEKEEIKEDVLKVEEKPKKSIVKLDSIKKDETKLIERINDFFDKNNISLLNKEVIRKNREINCEATITSSVGDLNYFVKVRDKKVINDGDLSLAHGEGNTKKLPVIFLSTGRLTKKAKIFLEKVPKGQLIFMELN